METDEAELVSLFHATGGDSKALKARVDSVHKLNSPTNPTRGKFPGIVEDGPSAAQSTDDDDDEDPRSPLRRKYKDVTFLRPPEVISTGDEALRFNLIHGRCVAFSPWSAEVISHFLSTRFPRWRPQLSLRSGAPRYDDAFEHHSSGPKGEGFYVTDLGRSIGERLNIEVRRSGRRSCGSPD